MLKTFPRGGVHPESNKFSATQPIESLSLPETVTIPISQHIGAPAQPQVKKGDMVKTGQIIAQSGGFVSSNIHASVSGKVSKIDKIIDNSGYKRDAIFIKTGEEEWVEGVDLSEDINDDLSPAPEDIIKKVQQAGIVGLGGATFPSHVKLSVPGDKKAEYLILNGVECEPYLTADHRLMLEYGEEILIGAQLLKKALGVKKVLIGIENNKPDAIDNLRRIISNYGFKDTEVHALQVKYPQGGEKQLVKALLHREVPPGGIPIDIGVVAFNVGSVLASYEAVQKNKPLIRRVVTVTGKNIKKPANFWIRLGTPVSHIFNQLGGLPEDTGKVVNGGPMMGKALNSLDAPVVKGSSAIVVFPEDYSKRPPLQNCIRCSKCVASCPMGLEPYILSKMAQKGFWDRMEERRALDCMECGSCVYICPAARPLLDYIRLGKAQIMQRKKKKKA